MANNYSIPSDKIRIFPSSTRSSSTEQYGNTFLTEYNLSSIVNKLLRVDGFIITQSSNITDNGKLTVDSEDEFEFNLGGYFIQAPIGDIIKAASGNITESSDLYSTFVHFYSDSSHNVYAGIIIENVSSGGADDYKKVQGEDVSTGDSSIYSDSESYTYSLKLFTSSDGTNYSICTDSKLRVINNYCEDEIDETLIKGNGEKSTLGGVDDNGFFTPIYIDDGVIKEFDGDIGASTNPVYVKDGQIRPITGNVGNSTTPTYLDGGTTKASSATIGSSVEPIYLNAGTITKSTGTVGATNKFVYLDSGRLLETGADIGGSAQPVYMEGGELRGLGSTVGSVKKPVYLNAGVISPLADNVGSSSTPVYMENGEFKACSSVSLTASSIAGSLTVKSTGGGGNMVFDGSSTCTMEAGTNMSFTVTSDDSGEKTVINCTLADATTTSAGLMSAADKAKLDGIAENANSYTYIHPTVTANDTTSSETTSAGSTVDVISSVTRDTSGHVTGVNTKTITLPSDVSGSISSASGTVTQNKSEKAEEYPLLAKASSSTDDVTGTTQFAAGVTLNPGEGSITATTFNGTATEATHAASADAASSADSATVATAVNQTAVSVGGSYPVLFSGSSKDDSGFGDGNDTVSRHTGFYFNPSSGTLTVSNLQGTLVNNCNLTFNGTTYAYNGGESKTVSWYAPTSSGSSGQYLMSNGSGAPSWSSISSSNISVTNTATSGTGILYYVEQKAKPDGSTGWSTGGDSVSMYYRKIQLGVSLYMVIYKLPDGVATANDDTWITTKENNAYAAWVSPSENNTLSGTVTALCGAYIGDASYSPVVNNDVGRPVWFIDNQTFDAGTQLFCITNS